MSRSKVSKAQHVVLTALACGATVESAARRAGVTERTVYRYLADPAFRQRVHQARADQFERTAGALTAAAIAAVKRLTELLQDPSASPAVQRSAARDLLEMNLRYREGADWETRLAALEARLAGTTAPAAAEAAPLPRPASPAPAGAVSASCSTAAAPNAPEEPATPQDAPHAPPVAASLVPSSSGAEEVPAAQPSAVQPATLPPASAVAGTPRPGRGRAKTWLRSLEQRVHRIDTDAASADDGRTAFFADLGRVLAPFPEAKAAVGCWLDQPTTAPTTATGAYSFVAALQATLAPFPDAQAAVDHWLSEDRDTC
jgi:hypothetical protein